MVCLLEKTRSSADADKPTRRIYRSLKVTKHGTTRYVRYGLIGFPLACYSNFVPNTPFFRYSTSKCRNLEIRVKVIGTDTDRSATCDFLLTFCSIHGLISYRFRDERRFQSKIAIFPNRVYLTSPLTGFPWNWVLTQRFKKLECWATRKF